MQTLMRRNLTHLAAGVAAISGCAAEVGDGYTGEVLMSLEGEVTAGPDVDPDHELVLHFRNRDRYYLVDGTTTGEFPSQFRFEVTTPPPEEVYESFSSTGRLYYAHAWLMVVPKDHPAKYRELYSDFDALEPAGRESFTTDLQHCVDPFGPKPRKRCVEQQLSCTVSDCEVVYEAGPSELLSSEYGSTNSVSAQDSTHCTFEHRCTDAGCARRVWCCDQPPLTQKEVVWSHGRSNQRVSCDVEGVTGDPELAKYLFYGQVAALDLRIFYSKEDRPPDPAYPRSLHLRKGYNVFRTVESPTFEENLALYNCRADALEQAFGEYNERRGTSINPMRPRWGNYPGAKRVIEDRHAELLAECGEEPSYSYEQLPTNATGLEITLGTVGE